MMVGVTAVRMRRGGSEVFEGEVEGPSGQRQSLYDSVLDADNVILIGRVASGMRCSRGGERVAPPHAL